MTLQYYGGTLVLLSQSKSRVYTDCACVSLYPESGYVSAKHSDSALCKMALLKYYSCTSPPPQHGRNLVMNLICISLKFFHTSIMKGVSAYTCKKTTQLQANQSLPPIGRKVEQLFYKFLYEFGWISTF